MKLLHVLLIFLIGAAFYGCEKKYDGALSPEDQSHRQTEGFFRDGEELTVTLQKVAQHLAQHPEALSGRLAGDMREAPALLSELGLGESFPSLLHNNEGEFYEIGVESFRGSILNNGEALRVALDPDRFSGEEPSFPAYVFDRAENKIRVEQINKTEALTNGLPFPLALVTLEDRREASWSEIKATSAIFREYNLVDENADFQPGGSSPNAGVSEIYYLYVTKIQLLVAKDDFSMEEFELYVGEANAPYVAQTTHKFDGSTRPDASGRPVYYPDVNLINTTYIMPVPIALWPLSNTTPISIAPIEDDCIAGEHRNWEYPNTLSKMMEQSYHRPTHTILSNMWRQFALTGEGCTVIFFTDNDDIYEKGDSREWTLANTPNNEFLVDLGHLQIWFTKSAIQRSNKSPY